MLKIATNTKLSPEDAIKKAVEFFGKTNYQLKIIDQTNSSVSLEGGGGSIEIVACQENGKTNVEFLSREWDSATKEFIRLIKSK
jgi:hypothetical protein